MSNDNSDSQSHIYIISDNIHSQYNHYKVGFHTGSLKKLITRYSTDFPELNVYLFRDGELWHETSILSILKPYRITKNFSGVASEWINRPLDDILQVVIDVFRFNIKIDTKCRPLDDIINISDINNNIQPPLKITKFGQKVGNYKTLPQPPSKPLPIPPKSRKKSHNSKYQTITTKSECIEIFKKFSSVTIHALIGHKLPQKEYKQLWIDWCKKHNLKVKLSMTSLLSENGFVRKKEASVHYILDVDYIQ